MKLSDLRVGDAVRFRDWDDMAAEFGVSTISSIQCLFGFPDNMRILCGQECTVTAIKGSQVFVDLPEACQYVISADMLEPITTFMPDLPEESEFLSILKTP